MVTDELWGLQGILNSTAYERMRPNGSLLFHVRVGHGGAGKYNFETSTPDKAVRLE